MMKGLTGPLELTSPHERSPRLPPLVLVMDDDPDIRALLQLHLDAAGYRVATAEDAVAAGHFVAHEVPDLIIADFRMPYMDGVEFVAALRGDATIRDIPVIFITSPEAGIEIAGRTFGFPLLVKPLLATQLLDTVAAQLRAHGVQPPEPHAADSPEAPCAATPTTSPGTNNLRP